MIAVILNDTSHYHYGCKKVIEYLISDLQSCGYADIKLVGQDIKKIQEARSLGYEADLVVLNGEGTMHSTAIKNRETPIALLENLSAANHKGIKTALINTVWQNMEIDDFTAYALENSYVSCRESYSHNELKIINKDSEIHLDLSYFVKVPFFETSQSDKLIGKFFGRTDSKQKNLDIFEEDWDTIVNKLRKTNWFITGRHHELYAACKARCPFTVLKGNTWKNEGLLATAEVTIPSFPTLLDEESFDSAINECQGYLAEYEKLFNWMENQPRFSLKGKINELRKA